MSMIHNTQSSELEEIADLTTHNLVAYILSTTNWEADLSFMRDAIKKSLTTLTQHHQAEVAEVYREIYEKLPTVKEIKTYSEQFGKEAVAYEMGWKDCQSLVITEMMFSAHRRGIDISDKTETK